MAPSVLYDILLITSESDSECTMFAGPIRNSHCPLVIGSFIKMAMGSYFEGYMDNVSFAPRCCQIEVTHAHLWVV